MRDIAIYGAGGFGLEVAQLIEQINREHSSWNMIGYFDDWVSKGESLNGYPVLGGMKELNAWTTELDIALAIGNPRKRIENRQSINNDNIRFPKLIHPTAIADVDRHVKIGQGTIVCAGNILTTQVTIGQYVILNLACTVGHQTRIGDYSSFMPTCNISGEVEIGDAVFMGTGAKIINKKRIGSYSVIGAGAVVIKDIPSNCTAVGVPAKVVKQESEDCK